MKPWTTYSIGASNWVPENANPFNFDFHDVSWFKKNRRGADESHTARGARRDNVPWFKRHGLRNMGYESRDVEDQVACVGFLQPLAVQAQLNRKTTPIAQLSSSWDKGWDEFTG